MSTGGSTLNPPPKKSRNKPSVLLTKEENDLVFKLLDDRCVTLSTAVVQLLLTEPPTHSKWNKIVTGVVCFVKDNNVRAYFIEVYDIDNVRGCVWQQEVFYGFDYKATRPNLHTFEAESCRAGLYFVDSAEASDFQKIVESKVTILDKRARTYNPEKQDPSLMPFDLNRALPKPPDQKKNKKKQDKNRPKYRKQDISEPTGFMHIAHIPLHTEYDHDVEDPAENSIEPKYQEFFNYAGINNEHLNNPKYRRAIYDFVNEFGGIDVCRQSMQKPLPKDYSLPTNKDLRDVSLNRPLHHRSGVAPPPPPTIPSNNKSNSKQSVGHSSIPPPPPLPPTHLNMPPPAPPAPSFAPPSGPPPPLAGGPPPPPPPPLPQPSLPISSNPPTNSNKRPDGIPPPMDGRSALLEQIRKGSKLNHVEPNSQSSNPSPKPSGGRDALLKEIQQGRQLKPVDHRPTKPVPASEDEKFANNLMEALKQRLERLKDSSSEEEDDEYDWSESDN